MAVSYTNLLECFNTIGKNFECSFILNNPIYEGGHKDKGILDLELFQWRETREGDYFLYSFKLKKRGLLERRDDFLQMDALHCNFNLGLNVAMYFRLRSALFHFRSKVNTEYLLEGRGIKSFFKSFKQGKILQKGPACV